MNKVFLGIDFGGTYIKGGAIDKNGEMLKFDKIPTESEKGVNSVIARLVELITRLIGEDIACGIGLGIPGLIDSGEGEVVISGNVKWERVKIVDKLKKHFSCPIKIQNDANVAALGECRFGVGKRFSDCVFLTLGTGVGSGIIINGKIFAGNKSAGAEIGHMVIHPGGEPCSCGNRGCLETYASATALKRETIRAIAENPDTLMREVPPDKIGGRTAFLYADRDEFAKKIVDKYVEDLAIGITNVANILRPEAIILGGGVAGEGENLLAPLRKKLSERIFAKGLGPKVEILCSTLKNAGVFGAAALNME